MSCQLADLGASIEISCEGEKKLVLKQEISEVSIVRVNIIKIATRQPLKTIYLKYLAVTSPVTISPLSLRNTINAWIANCICNAPGSSGGE